MIRLVLLSIVFSFIVSFRSALMAKAPWQVETTRQLPWGTNGRNPERMKRRERFFRSLNHKFFSGHQPQSSLDPKNVPTKVSNINDLPWKEYSQNVADSDNGEFEWPIEGGQITSGYGVRLGRFHEGLDISGHAGQPIHSAGNGRVVYVGSMNGYGHLIVIYHGRGITSVYAHNRENLVRVGQIIEKGQVIGTVGKTGDATGYHVHFEIRKNGKPQNPLVYDFDRSNSQT